MALTAQEVWRDYKTDGVPSSGAHDPKKSNIRQLLGQYEQIIDAFTSNGGLIYSSKASMDADLAHAANSMAWVVGDATAANNGIYRKSGASGSGSWTRVADLPYSFIVASDVGDGTPDAIQATSLLPVSGSALVLLNIFEANTGSPVTVSFNGGSPLTVKTNSGNDVQPGGLVSGMLVVGRVSGSTFRLVSDQASAAVLAQAEAAADRAEDARDATLSALSGIVSPKATLAIVAADAPSVDPDYYDVVWRDVNYIAGSGAKYRKVSSEPSHAGKVQNGNGVWYEIAEPVINPLMFGAKGDNTGNDAPAWNDAIAYLRTFGTNMPTLVGCGRQYRITDTINLTQLRIVQFAIDLQGGLITAATNGDPAFDMLDSEHVEISNGIVYGDVSAPPSWGLQIGRGRMEGTSIGRGAAYIKLSRLHFVGDYSSGCFLNSASEIFRADKCNFWNGHSNVAAACYWGDAKRQHHVTSDFFTVDVPDDTYSSFNDVLFTNCTFERIGGVVDSFAIILSGKTHSHHIVNSYGQCEYGSGILLYGEHADPVFDIHWESTNIKRNYYAATDAGDVILHNAKVVEYYLFATNAMFQTNSATGEFKIIGGSEISVRDTAGAVPLFFETGASSISFEGRLKLGSNGNLLTNLSNLSLLNGEIECDMPLSVFDTGTNRPTNGAYVVRSGQVDKALSYGVFANRGAIDHGSAGNLASATTLVIPPTGSLFYVTGTTNIDSIFVGPYDSGRLVTLLFQSGLTLQNSASLGTLLAGNFNTSANSAITLFCNGSLWVEVSRSNNVAA